MWLTCEYFLQSRGRDAVYQDYLDYFQSLGENECWYGLYDFEFEHACEGAADVSHHSFSYIFLYARVRFTGAERIMARPAPSLHHPVMSHHPL